MKFPFLLLCLVVINTNLIGAQPPRIVLDIPDYPLVFELDKGSTFELTRSFNNSTTTREIRLIDYRLTSETNYWFPDDQKQSHYISAEVDIEIDGRPYTLIHRPFQMPVVIEGLRLYVENIREWTDGSYPQVYADSIQRDVRLSATLEREPWGPVSFEFPLNDFRLFANSYNNTWAALVPYNQYYYHRGEDYGLIPDLTEIVAPFDGRIFANPLPEGDGKSNAIIIQHANGILYRASHMNIETIDSSLDVGSKVKRGQVIAKTGMTWDGRKAQHNDHHYHGELRIGLSDTAHTKLSTYPLFAEAYFRKYPDKVVAVAGGYYFGLQDQEITLDASRTLLRNGEIVDRYEWHLSDGRIVVGETCQVSYSQPGQYSEELRVFTKRGAESRSFAHIRVYGQNVDRNISRGWIYHNKLRGAKVGESVHIRNRLNRLQGSVTIDFGDGKQTELQSLREIYHIYEKPGIYTITISSIGIRNEPIMAQIAIRVLSK